MADSKSSTGLCAQRKHTSQLSAYIDNFVLVDLDRVLTLPFTASFTCGLCMKSCSMFGWQSKANQERRHSSTNCTCEAFSASSGQHNHAGQMMQHIHAMCLVARLYVGKYV